MSSEAIPSKDSEMSIPGVAPFGAYGAIKGKGGLTKETILKQHFPGSDFFSVHFRKLQEKTRAIQETEQKITQFVANFFETNKITQTSDWYIKQIAQLDKYLLSASKGGDELVDNVTNLSHELTCCYNALKKGISLFERYGIKDKNAFLQIAIPMSHVFNASSPCLHGSMDMDTINVMKYLAKTQSKDTISPLF